MSELKLMKFLIKKFGFITFYCSGDCMTPWISEGKIIIKEYKTNIKQGDIVLVFSDNFFKVHRVIEINKDVLTKGDLTLTFDSNKNIENIVGYVYSMDNIDKKYYHDIKKICGFSYKIAELYSKKNKGYQKKIDKMKENIIRKSKIIISTIGDKKND